MPNFIHATEAETPALLSVARGLYGEVFASTNRRVLEETVGEWSELSEAERSFATAHMLYLAIEAQATTQSLLADMLDAVEELELAATLPVATPPENSELDEPDPGAFVPFG